MDIGFSNANVPTQCDLSTNISMPTIEQRLLMRKSSLEDQLKDINSALEALQANPEVLKIMCLISKVNY